MLAERDRPLLATHGFSAALIASLVNEGLATLTHEKVRGGDTLVEVDKVRIMDVRGRAAIIAVGAYLLRKLSL